MSGALMKEEMLQQPGVLAAIAERAGAVRTAIREVAPWPLRAVVLTGRGSSGNAAVLGRYAIELASGAPTGLAAPSLQTRYRADVDYRGVLVIGLSQSGETPEIVATCERLRAAGGVVIGLTNCPNSPLSTVCDLILGLDAGDERAVPATKTVTAQMALMLVVASALTPTGDAKDAPFGMAELVRLPDAVAEVLDDDRPIAKLARRWSGFDRLLVSARGLLYAAALETALKIKEAAEIQAEGISTFDLLHGPIAAVNPRVPVLSVSDDDPTAGDAAALTDRLAETGCPIATCSTALTSALHLRAGLPAALYPIIATIRGQQLAYHLSIARGLDPDVPLGLSKVTATT